MQRRLGDLQHRPDVALSFVAVPFDPAHQQVRSAVCAPLIGSENRVVGVLYVDSLTSAHRFDENDLDFVIAFSGIVAVAK